MRNTIVDVRDREELSDALMQVLFFVEAVNSIGASGTGEAVFGGKKRRQEQNLKAILFALGQKICRKESLFGSSPKFLKKVAWVNPEFVSLALRAGLKPRFDPRLIEEIVRVLLRPTRLIVNPGEPWQSRPAGNLQPLPQPQWLHERIWLCDSAGYQGFTNRPGLGADLEPHNGSTLYWEEVLDPISVLRSFLIHGLEESPLTADYYIQDSLRHTFGLRNKKVLKYTLAAISRRFNELFYGSSVPLHKHVQAERSATLGVSLIVGEIVRILDKQGGPGSSPEDSNLRRALGIFLFLRFSRQLRSQYYWHDDSKSITPVVAKLESSKLWRDVALMRFKRFFLYNWQVKEREAAQEEQPQPRSFTFTGQCVGALRPLEYTYFQTRMFGALSFVPGLNYIFRGGLLPYTDSGRSLTLAGPPGSGKTVLALQMMCDIASCGGLALYFSFEESYDSIIDRLVTFNLYDREKFDVRAGSSIDAELRRRALQKPRRGLLLLYTRATEAEEEPAPYPLLDVIQEVAKSADGEPDAPPDSAKGSSGWRWRALTIDSVNALKLNPDGEDRDRRVSLHKLIETIDKNKFLGVILREQGKAEFDLLSYLSDTVVELGVDPSTHMPWIEVKKCRSQNYQPGPHPFRILDARGVSIYPSLASRMSSLRHRMRSTLSEHRMIPFPPSWRQAFGVQGMWEKSSTLVWGPAGTGKSIVLRFLGTEPSVAISNPRKPEIPEKNLGPPVSILMVTFGTSELHVQQGLRDHKVLNRRWSQVKRTRLRWYSPGANFTGDQLVSELWALIQQGRREGWPIERIIFDETEVAEMFLPALRGESLFWPTLHELTSTEAITSFFVSGSDNGRSKVVEILGASMDYVLRTFHEGEKEEMRRCLEIEKTPALWARQLGNRVELQLDPIHGVIV